jgi:acyl-CoA synthetase (AMP-forming)/AMP-acid ligase II
LGRTGKNTDVDQAVIDSSVRACIDTRAQTHAGAVFLVAPEPQLQLSYADLRAQCELVESKLRGLGLAPGDKAAFLLDNGYWTTSLFLGTMYAGMVSVPLNAVAGVPQVQYILEHCDANVVFCSDAYREKFGAAIDACPRKLTVIRTHEDSGPDWQQITAGTAPTAAGVTGEDDALLLYTSGTTGLPKGARLSNRAVLAGGMNTAIAHELTPDDRALCVLPLYHINGEMVTVMGPLVSASSVVMPHRYSASDLWRHVLEHRCTWMSVVPTIIKYMLDRAEHEDIDFGNSESLKHLRFARSASAPLPASVQQQFESTFGVPMIETMGLTETCAPILSNPMPPGTRKSGSPGKAFGNEVEVANENGERLPDGTVGELVVRGANVLSGYYKNPQASATAFGADGWFRTGDLGYRDSDGYFFITGRSKELIIKGGENIAPREIDDALYLHEAVLEAAAIGVADDNYGQDVQACVRLRDGYSATEEELIEHCRSHVGKFKAPSRVYFLADLPKGPSGKIQRLKLPEMIAGS